MAHGRKPIYRQEYHDAWAWSLAIRGCTDMEIAEAMGVSRKTISEWKYTVVEGQRVLSSFGEALANGKEAVDSQVEQALFKRACGYTVTEREQYTEDGKRKVRLRDRHIPPETRAAEAWLYNRQHDRWKSPRSVAINFNNTEVENSVDFNVVVLPPGSDCMLKEAEKEEIEGE